MRSTKKLIAYLNSMDLFTSTTYQQHRQGTITTRYHKRYNSLFKNLFSIFINLLLSFLYLKYLKFSYKLERVSFISTMCVCPFTIILNIYSCSGHLNCEMNCLSLSPHMPTHYPYPSYRIFLYFTRVLHNTPFAPPPPKKVFLQFLKRRLFISQVTLNTDQSYMV